MVKTLHTPCVDVNAVVRDARWQYPAHCSALITPVHRARTRQNVRGGDVRLFGFIGGNYSRRVRILLSPEYAQRELLRLHEVIAGCDASIAAIDEELNPILVTGDSYMLYLKVWTG